MTQPAVDDPQPHRDLIALPATLENIDAKLNHLIVRAEVGIKSSARAEVTSEKARALAEQARAAAQNAGTIAVKAIQGIDALPVRQRMVAVAAGGIVGGAAVSFIVWVVLLAIGTTSLASCLPGH